MGNPVSDYLPDVLTIATWQTTYAVPMPVIDITNLQAKDEEECNPPKIRVPRGRPKKKREERPTYRGTRGLRAEDVERGDDGEAIIGADRLTIQRKNVCSTCGQAGYNKRACKTPHM